MPSVALLLVKVNGQFTPPWATRPLAPQSITLPLKVPAPDPDTLILLAHVAVKVTAALVAVVGVIVYLTLPHPEAGVEAVAEDQVPAKASIDVAPDGDVGVDASELLSFFPVRRS